jgi:hypothetical protein
MATAGNAMAHELLGKLEHHLRTIVTTAEGQLHWPEKYRQQFEVRRPW